MFSTLVQLVRCHILVPYNIKFARLATTASVSITGLLNVFPWHNVSF